LVSGRFQEDLLASDVKDWMHTFAGHNPMRAMGRPAQTMRRAASSSIEMLINGMRQDQAASLPSINGREQNWESIIPTTPSQ
jgi:hypothetical protein